MRMWMVPVKIMCRKHLLGEHVECHMIESHLFNKKKISGYVRNNCIEPTSLRRRHNQLVTEMEIRKYNHDSPLKHNSLELYYLPSKEECAKVNVRKSQWELLKRCKDCRRLYNETNSIERN